MDKIDTAVARLKEASAMSLHYYGEPLLLTYSGGKDSDVVQRMAEIAGIPYEIQHSHTTADAPETVRHVREKFRELELKGLKCTINYPVYKGKRVSMWTLIEQRGMPPTRIVRYCCEVLKESNNKKRFIATGIRWSESVRRKKTRGAFETINKNPEKRIILNNDNDDKRMLFESCAKLGTKAVNPIIDWKDHDVWEFLKSENVKCNPLYCEFGRVGCVGCPMAGKASREREFLRWPAYRRNYLAAFDRMQKVRVSQGKELFARLESPLDVFRWWMEHDELPGQIDLLEEDYDQYGL